MTPPIGIEAPLPPRRLAVAESLRPDGWHLYALPFAEGLPQELTEDLRVVLRALSSAFAGQSGWHRHLFLAFWRFGQGDVAELFNNRVELWRPSFGLGVWPTRPAPGAWTQEAFLEASAARLEGREPELNRYPLIRIGAEDRTLDLAADIFAGSGSSLQIFTTAPFAALVASGNRVLLPTLTARQFRNERFYLPLLDSPALAGAPAARLESWLDGVEIYLRESPEDRATLIASRKSLAAELHAAAAVANLTLDWSSTQLGSANVR